MPSITGKTLQFKGFEIGRNRRNKYRKNKRLRISSIIHSSDKLKK